MRTTHSIIWLLLLPAVVASGCREACTSDELRYGDRCIPRPDAGREETDAAFVVGPGPSDEMEDGGTPDAPPTISEDGDGSSCTNGLLACADLCSPNPCGHGTCSVTDDGTTFECECEPDWTGEGVCDHNTNPALASLELSAGKLSPAFDPDVLEYTAALGIGAPTVRLTAASVHAEGTSIKIDGRPIASGNESTDIPIALNGESRTVAIEAVADDGSSRIYVVRLRRTLVRQAMLEASESSYLGADLYPGPVSFLLPQGALAIDGSVLAVGMLAAKAPRHDGALQLFVRDRGLWSRGLSRTGDGPTFGAALALVPGWLLVGNAPATIRAYSREHLASQDGHQVLWHSEAEESTDELGYGRILAGSGNVLVASAPKYEPDSGHQILGQVFVYEFYNGQWQWSARLTSAGSVPGEPSDAFGTQVASDGNVIAVARIGDPEGTKQSVYMFEKAGPGPGGWKQVQKIEAPDDRTNQSFGMSIAVSGDRLAVSSGVINSIGSPGIYIFRRNNDGWTQESSIKLSDPADTARDLIPQGFGAKLAFVKNVLVVAAPMERAGVHGIVLPEMFVPAPDPGGGSASTGSAYVFVEHPDGWKLDARIGPEVGSSRSGFGTGLVASDNSIVLAGPDGVSIFGPDCANADVGFEPDGC